MHVPNRSAEPLLQLVGAPDPESLEPDESGTSRDRFRLPRLSVFVDYPRRVVVASGDIIGRSGDLLGEALSLLLATNPGDTTLDLSHVDALDAAGFAMLADVHKRLNAVGAQLRAVAPRRHLLRLFDITNMLENSP